MTIDITWQQYYEKLGLLIAQTWESNDFKQNFIENPKEVMEAEGLQVPDGIEFDVSSSSDIPSWKLGADPSDSTRTVFILILPLPDKPDDLSAEELRVLLREGMRFPAFPPIRP